MEKETPRKEIERLIEAGDLRGLLSKAGLLHGHFCSYLAYGVKAGYLAMREIGLKSTGMEEVIAIIETNNCFSDGVQMVTGCSFGNNALIFRDIGKTAVTVARRDGAAIRLIVDPNIDDTRVEEYPEANELWEKIVVKREKASHEEHERLTKLFTEMSFAELSKPTEEIFRIKRIKITVPEYAPIFASLKCSVCGEKVMMSRARLKEEKPVCLDCAGMEHYVLDGRGISTKGCL